MSEKKKPQDHQQPKDKPKRITVKDIDLTVDPKIFDDLEIIEMLSDINSGSATAASR